MEGYDHKDLWRRSGRHFVIEVSRHEVHGESLFREEGPHRWAIYAYVYPDHPLFKQINADGGLWQEAFDGLRFHGGVTFLRPHANEEFEICSWQVGCDFHHDGESHYTYLANENDAQCIFMEAGYLFDELMEMVES